MMEDSEVLEIPDYEFFNEWEPTRDFLLKSARLYQVLARKRPFDEKSALASSVQLYHCTMHEGKYLERGCHLLLEQCDFVSVTVKLIAALRVVEEQQWHFLAAVQNLTSCSREYSAALARNDIFPLLMEYIADFPRLCREGSPNNCSTLKNILSCCLSIILNIVRDPENAYLFNDNHWKRELDELTWQDNKLECSADEVKTLHLCRTLVLAYVLNKEENSLLEKHGEILDHLMKMLHSAASTFTGSRTYLGFSVLELLNALEAMTVNAKICTLLLKTPLAVNLLKSLCSEKYPGELFSASKVLLHLAFDPQNRQLLDREYQIQTWIADLKGGVSISEEVKKTLDSILWLFHRTMPEVATVKEQIFMSYSSTNKKTILTLVSMLKSRGIPVWIDVEQMRGSTLDAMANGIDQSSWFLMCMSESYKLSAPCRMEAEYAVARRKAIIPLIVQEHYKPDGWLGFILGAKLYYDFSGRRDFNTVFNQLMQLIHKSQSTEEETAHVRDSKTTTKWMTTIASWDCKSLCRWLSEQGLDVSTTDVVEQQEIDGGMFMELISMHQEAPEHFYNCLTKDLGMNLRDKLRLMQAIRQLKNNK